MIRTRHSHRLTAALIITLQKISTGHFSITCDTQFATSRMKFKESQKFLKDKGKLHKPNDAEAVYATQLWQQGTLGTSNPATLQQTV